MTAKTAVLTARERILQKAEELFYKQGYQATGINQIIEESGVAKATFYAHFPSKDDLCVAYLRTISEREAKHFCCEMDQCKTPLEKFMCTAELLVPWVEESDYKGCAFLNMVPEVTDSKHPIRKEAAKFYRHYEEMIEEVAKDLVASDKKKYGHLKPGVLAKQYMTLIAGGLTLASLHHSPEPLKNAVRMIRKMVE